MAVVYFMMHAPHGFWPAQSWRTTSAVLLQVPVTSEESSSCRTRLLFSVVAQAVLDRAKIASQKCTGFCTAILLRPQIK